MDWKDALSKLNVPDAPESSETETPPVTQHSPVQKETIRVIIDKKGRKGKTATIIEGFLCDDDTLQKLARTLKQKIGTGGSARGGEILLQGDWKERAFTLLSEMGYKVRKS